MLFSKDMEEHRHVVKQVLSILCKHNLYLKPEKHKFEKEKVEYLGLVVSEEGMVEMDSQGGGSKQVASSRDKD